MTATVKRRKKRTAGPRVGSARKSRKPKYFTISVTFEHGLDEFLQAVGNEARSTGGFKLSKSLIVRGLVRVLRELKVDMTGVKTEDGFVGRLREAMGLK